jgi:hypothetical protein
MQFAVDNQATQDEKMPGARVALEQGQKASPCPR